jgi:hypothetical protein
VSALVRYLVAPCRLAGYAGRGPRLDIPGSEAAAGEIHRVRGLNVCCGSPPSRGLSQRGVVDSVGYAGRSLQPGPAWELIDIPVLGRVSRIVGTRDSAGQGATA